MPKKTLIFLLILFLWLVGPLLLKASYNTGFEDGIWHTCSIYHSIEDEDAMTQCYLISINERNNLYGQTGGGDQSSQ